MLCGSVETEKKKNNKQTKNNWGVLSRGYKYQIALFFLNEKQGCW